jgi:hypothetical protein
MNVAVSLYRVESGGGRQRAVKSPPSPSMPMPLVVDSVGSDPVEASEGRIELLAKSFRQAGTVALDEAILRAA